MSGMFIGLYSQQLQNLETTETTYKESGSHCVSKYALYHILQKIVTSIIAIPYLL